MKINEDPSPCLFFLTPPSPLTRVLSSSTAPAGVLCLHSRRSGRARTSLSDHHPNLFISIMGVIVAESPAHSIFVRCPGAKCVRMDVKANQMVKEVKKDLALRIGLSPRDCYLHYGGKPMSDAERVMECGMIVDGSTVHLCVRQRGGCFIITFSILTLLFLATLAAPCTCGFSLFAFALLPLVFILPWCCL